MPLQYSAHISSFTQVLESAGSSTCLALCLEGLAGQDQEERAAEAAVFPVGLLQRKSKRVANGSMPTFSAVAGQRPRVGPTKAARTLVAYVRSKAKGMILPQSFQRVR